MLDFDFMISHISLVQKGLILTLEISALGILLSLIIGLFCAIGLSEAQREKALNTQKSKTSYPLKCLEVFIKSMSK